MRTLLFLPMIILLVSAANFRGSKWNDNNTRHHFSKDSAFQILSSYRSITTQSSAPDTDRCKGWSISKRDLYTIIKHSKMIDGMDWHHFFDVWPCIIIGQLKQKGELYHFEVNGGSWLYLKSKDTTIILGDYNPHDKKYFISTPTRD